jgi:UDP-glucuronate 4-epimerase
VTLGRFIEVLESCLGRKAVKRYLPMQPGDVLETHADIGDTTRALGYRPETTIEDGLPRFAEWLAGRPRDDLAPGTPNTEDRR